MSFSVVTPNQPQVFQVAGLGSTYDDHPIALVIIGGGLLALLVYGIAVGLKREARIRTTIAEREGLSGLLKYEAGSAALRVGSALTTRALLGDHYNSNRRQRRRARKR